MYHIRIRTPISHNVKLDQQSRNVSEIRDALRPEYRGAMAQHISDTTSEGSACMVLKPSVGQSNTWTNYKSWRVVRVSEHTTIKKVIIQVPCNPKFWEYCKYSLQVPTFTSKPSRKAYHVRSGASMCKLKHLPAKYITNSKMDLLSNVDSNFQ